MFVTNEPNVIDIGATHFRNLQSRLGLASPQWFWHDFIRSPVDLGSPGVAGTGVPAASQPLGAFRLDTGATANSYIEYYMGFGNTSPRVSVRVQGGASKTWGIVVRLKMNTAVDANALCFLGVRDVSASNFVKVGVIGSVSTTNYVVQSQSANLDTGLAISTSAFKDFYIYRTAAGITYVEPEGGAIVSGANIYPAADCGPYLSAQNGATAASRQIDFGYIGLLFPKV